MANSMEAAFRSIEFFAAPEDPVDFPGLDASNDEEEDHENGEDDETKDEHGGTQQQQPGATLHFRIGLFLAVIILIAGAVAAYYRFWKTPTDAVDEETTITNGGGRRGTVTADISHPFPSPPPSSMECIMDIQAPSETL